MIKNLLTEEQLMKSDESFAEYLSHDESVRWEELNPSVRQAYGRYSGFADQTLREKMEWGELTPLDVFYNTYFWIVAFSKRYQADYGSNAGIEQQVFKVLETAPPDVDWKIAEDIVNSVS